MELFTFMIGLSQAVLPFLPPKLGAIVFIFMLCLFAVAIIYAIEKNKDPLNKFFNKYKGLLTVILLVFFCGVVIIALIPEDIAQIPVLTYSFDALKCNKREQVYSGPGEEYLRPYNETAFTDTNDLLRVFGTEKGWVLIRYPSEANGGYRYGWTKTTAIPENERSMLTDINFSRVKVRTKKVLDVTDDPDEGQNLLTKIGSNNEVTALAFLNESREWIYVEFKNAEGELTRGFVNSDGLKVQ